jgi:hypothetical protein
MTLQKSFAELIGELEGLRRALDNLLWAVVEAQPEKEKGHSLIVHYDRVSEDLIGLMKEAAIEAGLGYKAAERQIDLPEARQALTHTHSLFLDVSGQFFSEIMSFEHLENLNSLVREDRAIWEYWVKGVTDGLENCLQPMELTNRALFNCWQALSEHDGRVTVSVKNINAGQQFNLGEEKSERVRVNP